MTIPMAFGLFAMVAFNFVDTLYVARLGSLELAAMSFTFPVIMLISSVALGLGIGTASTVSRAIGREDQHRVKRLTTDGLALSLVAVTALAVIGLVTIDPLFTALGADTETLPLVRQYMRVWYCGMPFVVIPMVGNNAIRATGDTMTPGLIMIGAAIINVALDPLLIFGLWGFPRLELVGAAAATVIARALTLIVSLAILHFREHMIEWSIPPSRDLWESWKQILFVGVPTAATNVLTPIAMGVITRLAAGYGAAVVAAVGVGTRVEAIVLMVMFALSSSLVPFIGQNWGAGKLDRIHTAQGQSIRFALAWGTLWIAALFALARPLGELFRRFLARVPVVCRCRKPTSTPRPQPSAPRRAELP